MRSVKIRGEEFKFCCAHFVSYKGFRERLHGHNYTVEVELSGPMSEHDGYVIDFGVIKRNLRVICKQLNERVIVPMNSDTLSIRITQPNPINSEGPETFTTCIDQEFETIENSGQVEITVSNAFFSFPKSDCALLPIKFSTAEELSTYISKFLEKTLQTDIEQREIRSLTVRVFERPTQAASYTVKLPLA